MHMARPSKLTDKQWAEIESRHLRGESIKLLAKEFDVAYSTVYERVSVKNGEIKSLANQIVDTDKRFLNLTVSDRVSVINFADELSEISGHLASAAKYGSMTAHRLAAIAHTQTAKIDESASLETNSDAIKSVMALTRGANDAASIGLSLLSANKDAANPSNNEAPAGLNHFYGDDD